MKKMRNKKIVVIIAGILFFLIGVKILKGGVQASETVRDGFTEITDVEGVSFYMDDRLLDLATAITQISEETGLDDSSYYVYKNGIDQYILFNMDKVVCIVQKGTDFGFDEKENKEEALKSSNICNIWFEKSGKELDIRQADNTFYTKVNAQITITRSLYGDFTGELVTTTDGTEEWSIFVGVPGTGYDKVSENNKKVIESIAETLHVTKKDTDVNESFDQKTEEEEPDTGEQEESKEEDQPGTETFQEEEPSVPENVTIIEETDSDVSMEETQGEEETFQNVMENTGVSSEHLTEKVTEVLQDSADLISVQNNQREKKKNGQIFESDIYSMLDIGETGSLTVYNEENGMLEQPAIHICQLYKGADAIELIRQNLTDTDYVSAKDGCSYQAVVYDVDYSQCTGTPYVNIKIRGVDGNNLKYRGVKYTKKTHDILNSAKQEGAWVKGYICYYEIPNGCSEYVLECGDGTIENVDMITSAYYHITDK